MSECVSVIIERVNIWVSIEWMNVGVFEEWMSVYVFVELTSDLVSIYGIGTYVNDQQPV